MSNPRIRKSPSSPQKAKPTKQFKANMVALDAYSSTIALNETLMSTVKELYKTRDITNIKTATRAMDLLVSNDLNKFKKSFANISKLAAKKSGKIQAKRETKLQAEKEEMDKVVRGVKRVERVATKPKTRTKDKGTEAPTYEVEFIKDYYVFGAAWEAGNKKLIKMIEEHMKTKPNIKLTLGAAFQIQRKDANTDNDDPFSVQEEILEEMKTEFEIKDVQLYNIESVKPTILNLQSQMQNGFDSAIDRAKGSSWTVKRIDTLFGIAHTLKAARGSSYIMTPAKWRHPKCGLINIHNDDQECFRWCMLYHQSNRKANSHRTTALAKIVDKYDYTDITFPISDDDVTTFENNNGITINVWRVAEDKNTYLHRPGNVLHCRGGLVNLLLVENEKGEAHYIYIKNLEHMLHTVVSHYYKERKFCPFCSKTVDCKSETFEEHLFKYHYSTTNNCNLELPKEGASMSFHNHKDKMERPFMVYADWECSLIKTHEEGKTHRHVANSCSYYFVCTFDETRNIYETFKGEHCTIEMVKKLKELAKTCIAEMRENTKMHLSQEEEKEYKAAETCMLCNGFWGKG